MGASDGPTKVYRLRNLSFNIQLLSLSSSITDLLGFIASCKTGIINNLKEVFQMLKILKN